MPNLGTDLFVTFTNDPIPLNLVDIYRGMFLAVEQYHLRIGRVHGDLKLENFLLKDNKVILIDYE